jgi:hypothetical protein
MGSIRGTIMLNCREVTELCSLELEHPLGRGQRISLTTHLMMCSGCNNYRKQMKMLREVSVAYAAGKALPTEVPNDPTQLNDPT